MKVDSYWVPVTEFKEHKIETPKPNCTHAATVWALPSQHASYRRTICADCGELIGHIPTV